MHVITKANQCHQVFKKNFFNNFWYLFSVSFYYNKHIILRMRKNKAYLFNSVVNSHSGFQINLLSGKPRITSRSEPLCLLTKQLWGGDRAQIWCLFIAPCRLRAWTCWATWPQGFTNSKRDTTTCLPYVTHTYQHSKAGGMKKVCASSQTDRKSDRTFLVFSSVNGDSDDWLKCCQTE